VCSCVRWKLGFACLSMRARCSFCVWLGLDVSCVRVGVVELKLLCARNQTDNVGLTASTARECKLQQLCKGKG
jgi:hypothetical protein